MKFRLLLSSVAFICLVYSIHAQDPAQPSQPAQEQHSAAPAPVPGSNAGSQACPRFADHDWPIHQTIQAGITGMMDPAHLKPGKEVSAKVLYPIAYQDCSLDEEAVLSGHVTAAVSSKNPDASELGLVFDHADCNGHRKQEVHLRLIGLIAPPERGTMLHDVLPSEVAGGVRELPSTSSDGIDYSLNGVKFPPTVHPGLVVRMPKVALEPEGAPGCSAKISADRSFQIMPGTAFILTLERMTKPKQ